MQEQEIKSCRDRVNNPKISATAIKITYIILASGFVCHGFYKTMEKMKEGNILVKEAVYVLPKIKYPSVTFCYKYKHGSKKALETYASYFTQRWKASGESIPHSI